MASIGMPKMTVQERRQMHRLCGGMIIYIVVFLVYRYAQSHPDLLKQDD